METSARKRFFSRLLCAGVSQKELGRMLLLEGTPSLFDSVTEEKGDFVGEGNPLLDESLFISDSTALEWFREQNPRKYLEISDFFGSPADTKICEILDQKDISIVLSGDENYPAGLYEITNSPSVLFVRGNFRENPLLAIVGPRKPSLYGEGIVRKFVPDLVRAGFGIVS